MEDNSLVEMIVQLVVAPIFITAALAFLYFKWWRPSQNRTKAAAELETFDEFGLTYQPFGASGGGALLDGTFQDYQITVTPDDDLRILVTLHNDSMFDLDIGSGMSIEGFLEFRRADRLLDEALERREQVNGLVNECLAVRVLRNYLNTQGPSLAYFRLFEKRLGISPREGTARHNRWISPDHIRTLLPPLLELAQALDEQDWLKPDEVPLGEGLQALAGYREVAHAPPPSTSFEEDPLTWGRYFLQPTADDLGVTVGLGDDGVTCKGEVDGRAFEVSVAKESGGLFANLAVLAPVADLQLYYDPSEYRRDMVVLGGHCYHCGDFDDDESKAQLDALPPGTLKELLSLMRTQNIFLFNLDEETLDIELGQSVETLDRMAFAPCLRQLIDILGQLEGKES